MPDLTHVDHIEEPRIKATIMVPDDYLGDVLKLCQDRRGIQEELTYAGSRAMVVYDLPLNEVVFDFYDRLKSVTKGYASFDYQITGYRRTSGQDAGAGQRRAGRRAVHDGPPRPRRDARPRHVREAEGPDPPPHVQDPDPGGHRRPGDRARDRDRGAAQGRDREMLRRRRDAEEEALEKQKAGKKKMRQFGKVEIPQQAFISALKMDG
jgi:GTP-binding protein LepA